MRILLVLRGLPWPLAEGGGAQRNTLLYEALCRQGDVCAVAVNPRRSVASSPHAQSWSTQDFRWNGLREIYYAPGREAGVFRVLQSVLGGGLRRVAKNLAVCSGEFCVSDKRCAEELRAILRDFGPDLVVCRNLLPAVTTGAAFLSSPPTLLDYDDIDWRIQETRREQMPSRGRVQDLHHRFYDWHLERNVRKRLRHFAHIWTASEEDARILKDYRCSVLPNVPVLPSGENQRPCETRVQEPTILFVGGLTHGPNREGLDLFLDRIWPSICSAEPRVKLRVAGILPEDGGACAARWQQVSNVDVLGHVEDLGPEYERALFTIAPVYWGGGTKVKLLESLGRGKTCVVTPHALYGVGTHIRHGESVLCAASDTEFADACLKLVRSESLCRNLAAKGKDVIQEYFSVKRFNTAVAEVVKQFA